MVKWRYMKKRHCFIKLILPVLTLSLMTSVVLAEPAPSRLNQLMLNKATVFLPSRLTLGEDTRFVFKGKPGNQVILYISPKNEGYTLPNGMALHVGEDFEKLEGTISDKGVLELSLPVPDEPQWEGRYLFVDAITWAADDFSDVQQIQMLDSTGRRTGQNALVMALPAKTGGFSVMPSMPGIPGGALQQLTTTSQIMNSGDDRKKELLDDGTRNSDSLLDRNSFVTRPGLQQNILKPGP